MSKKVYIVTACVFIAILLGIVSYILLTSETRKAQEQLLDAVSKYNSSAIQPIPNAHESGCKEYKTIYEPTSNIVSIDYYIKEDFFPHYDLDKLDQHPDVKEQVKKNLETEILKHEKFLPIVALMSPAKASLRIRYINLANHKQMLVFAWKPDELQKIVNPQNIHQK